MNSAAELGVVSKGGAFWRSQVDLAVARRQTHEQWWTQNLKAYAPIDQSAQDYGADISTNRTFTLVERKKADLFYQRPDVTLNPSALLEGAPPTGPDGQPLPTPLSAHEEIINEKLSVDGIDATAMMDQVLFDIICTQGVGFTKMGYESVTVDQEMPDPAWQPSPLLPPEMQQPPLVTVPVPIHESCFWEHFSGKQAIIPHNFRSTEWDRAPFLGMTFELPLTPGNRQKYRLPEEFTGGKSKSTQFYDYGESQGQGEDVFTGVEIWYRSVLFREDISHPDHLTQLILIDGLDENEGIAIEQDSPYQTLDAQGQLTADSLKGFPIHPFSVRTLPDSAYVPSDGTMIRPLERELNVFRTQQVQFRDANLTKFMANGDVLPPESLNKIVRAPIGGIIVVPGEAFVGEGAIKELPHGSMPRESFLANDYVDNDLARTLGIDAQQLGVQGDSRTATADQLSQANANARLDKERGVILKSYIRGVTKFSTLIQRYLPLQQAAEIVGPKRAQSWDQWRHVVPSALAFTAMPDSALRVDQAVDRKAAVDLYSFLAQDPYIQKGRAKLLEKLLRKHHINPEGIVLPPDPPKPEPPKVSFALKGEDLTGPQAPMVFEILEQMGIKVSEQAKAQSQQLGALASAMNAAAGVATEQAKAETRHGGKLPQMESLSKHHADETGGMQGLGGPPAPMGPGGFLQ